MSPDAAFKLVSALPRLPDLLAHPERAEPALDQPPAILLVDADEISRRVLKGILAKGVPCRLVEAARAADALKILDSEKIDLIIVEMVMPEMSGPAFCRAVKANRKTQFIPILVMTNIQGADGEIEGISSGADEYLVKPPNPTVVRTRIQAMLRNKQAIDSLEEAETILFALAQAVEQRDSYTAGHCHRLAVYSVALGIGLGLPDSQLLALHRGGYLHDIGKISVPDAVLFKSGPLTPDEWTVMRDHTLRGEEICRPMRTLAPVLPIIRNHHERWDGSGYPDGLKGEDIPLLARILQIADIYDALTTARPYKPAFPHQKALEVLEEEARIGWRDPSLVTLFREVCGSAAHSGEQGPPAHLVTQLDAEIQPMQQSLENMRRELLK
ncbi:MAG: HD domain-containing phosphohydrolase [Bryobacteraceae bacterium]